MTVSFVEPSMLGARSGLPTFDCPLPNVRHLTAEYFNWILYFGVNSSKYC